jgi:hypothetical protein
MSAPQNPYDLPAVLLITDLARALRTSVRSIRRGLRRGDFPLPPMTSPTTPLGMDKKYRWARKDVEQFLAGGFRAFDRRAIRLRYSA